MAGKIKQLVFAEGVAVVAPTEVDIVDTVNDQTIAGTKTFDEQIVLKEIATPTTPASGYKAVYPKADGKMYTLDDTGIETEIGSGSGGGGINYIDNPDAEGNVTTGWAVYADAAATAPVNGTGGTANITFTASSSSPLRGTYSFLITKDAANRQGQGASYDFTIAAADKGRPLGIRWEGEASANYTGSSGTEYMVCYVYDVTNATVIATSNVNVPGGAFKGFTTFLATTSTSYRLIFHIAGTGTAAWTYKLDSVSVGPDTVVQGAAISDYSLITDITTNLGGTGTLTCRGRQDGDCLELRLLFVSSSDRTDAATDVIITLPSRFTIDTDKLNGGYTSSRYAGNIGNATLWDNSAGDLLVQQPYAASSTSISFRREDGLATLKLESVDNADNLQMTVLLPIVGWSSNVTMANRAVERFFYTSESFDAAGSTTVEGISGQATTNLTATRSKTISVPGLLATDKVSVELSHQNSDAWFNSVDLAPLTVDTTGAGLSGVYISGASSSSGTVTVAFQRYKWAANDDSPVFDWGTNLRWRLRVVSGGASVGFPVSTRNIVGDTSGTTVPSGFIGGKLNGTILAPSLTSTVTANAASIALTPGVWLLTARAYFNAAGTTTTSQTILGLSTTTATIDTDKQVVSGTCAAGVDPCMTITEYVNIAATTTYYLACNATFAVSTMSIHANSVFYAVRIA